jgi:hypothetical protein
VAAAAPGEIDTTFGVGGFLEIGDPEAGTFSPVIQQDGSLLRLEQGDACELGSCRPRYRLVALSPGGRLDLDAGRETVEHLEVGSLTGRLEMLRGGDLVIGVVDTSGTLGVLRMDSRGRTRAPYGYLGLARSGQSAADSPTNRAYTRLVAAVSEAPDNRLLVLHGFQCNSGSLAGATRGSKGALNAESWGVPLVDPCDEYSELEVLGTLSRLNVDGSLDAGFGNGGVVDVSGMRPMAVLGARADSSIVLADRAGQVLLFDATGRLDRQIQIDLADMSGVLLADGGLLLVGRRGDKRELWLARLRPDLTPDPQVGGGTGLERIDLSGLIPGVSELGVWPIEARLAANGVHLYVSLNMATVRDRGYLCAGVLRIALPGRAQPDPAFGRNGFACVNRAGLEPRRTRLTLAVDGGVFLSFPDDHLSDSRYSGMKTVRLMPESRASGAGMISMQGMTSSLEAGTARLVAGRASGNAGAMSIRWRAHANRYDRSWGVVSAPDRLRAQSVSAQGESPAAVFLSAEVVAEGTIQWPAGSDVDQEIAITLPESVLKASSTQCALQALAIDLDTPAGEAAYSRAVRYVSVPRAAGEPECLSISSATASVPQPGGGGFLGIPVLLGMLGLLLARCGVRPAARRAAASTGSTRSCR